MKNVYKDKHVHKTATVVTNGVFQGEKKKKKKKKKDYFIVFINVSFVEAKVNVQINIFKHVLSDCPAHQWLFWSRMRGKTLLRLRGVAWAKYWNVLDYSVFPTMVCSLRPSSASALLGEDCDHVVALGWSHSLPCVRLTINLLLHKEMSLLF